MFLTLGKPPHFGLQSTPKIGFIAHLEYVGLMYIKLRVLQLRLRKVRSYAPHFGKTKDTGLQSTWKSCCACTLTQEYMGCIMRTWVICTSNYASCNVDSEKIGHNILILHNSKILASKVWQNTVFYMCLTPKSTWVILCVHGSYVHQITRLVT